MPGAAGRTRARIPICARFAAKSSIGSGWNVSRENQSLATRQSEKVGGSGLQNYDIPDEYLKGLLGVFYNERTMSPEQMPSRAELLVFAKYCAANGLDPLAKDVYFVKDKKGKVHYQISIDGLRARSEASDGYLGRIGPQWCGKDGEWLDYWIKDEAPVAARVGLIRRGMDAPFWGFARLASYRPDRCEPWSAWGRMPEVMLAKCAEAQAHRAAFPKNCSRLYVPEEIIEAEVVESELPKAAPKQYRQVQVSAPAPAPASTEQQQVEEIFTASLSGTEGATAAAVEPAVKPSESSDLADLFAYDDENEPASNEVIGEAWKRFSAVYGRGHEARKKMVELGVGFFQNATCGMMRKIFDHLNGLEQGAAF